MSIQTPKFWYQNDPGLIAKFLRPAECLYSGVANLSRKKQRKNAYKSSLPVICVGNITAGGSGKTPTCIALYKILKENGIVLDPVFLTRGYGGSLTGPERVRAQGSGKTWGDEALLLAQYGSVIKSVNRIKGAYLAEDHNADCILMDDGAQNERLEKTLTLIVINGRTGLGNKRQIPAGPLREPLESGLGRADAFILIGKDETNVSEILPKDKPCFNANLFAGKSAEMKKGKSYFGFAGIAFPENFKKTLIDNDISLVGFQPFPDHYYYSEKDLKVLLANAEGQNAALITTEKDYVRLPEGFDKSRVEVLPVELKFEDEKKLKDFLKERLVKTNV